MECVRSEVQMYCLALADSWAMLRPDLDQLLADFDGDDTAVAEVRDQVDPARHSPIGERKRSGPQSHRHRAVADALAPKRRLEGAHDHAFPLDPARQQGHLRGG